MQFLLAALALAGITLVATSRPLQPEPAGAIVLPTGPELITKADPGQTSATAGALFSNRNCYSADGRYLVFESGSENLIAGQIDDGGTNDIFLYDRISATTVLVSHAAGSAQTAANASSMVPAISGDGRWVVYWTFATDIVAGQDDRNVSNPDVFLYDRLSGQNILVSHRPGEPLVTGDSNSFDPAISADGAYIFFTSAASDLVAGQTGGSASIFVYDRAADTIALVSHAAGAITTTSNGFSFGPVPSADGAYLAYLSNASNLVTGQTEDARRYDIFLWSRATGESVLVSHAAGSQTTAANATSSFPIITADGRHVTFSTAATNIVPAQADANQATDVFTYDRTTGLNILVSHPPGATSTTGNSGAIFPSISADGAYISFQSTAANLVPQDLNNLEDIFLWNRATGTNTLVSRSAAPLLSASANGRSYGSRPSADGNTLVFTSLATDLVAGQNSPSHGNVFLYDRLTGTMRLMSHIPGASATGGNGQSYLPLPSADAAYIAFNTQASDLVAQDTNGSGDVFIHDRAANANTVASGRASGADSITPNGISGGAQASADGRFVVFASTGTNFFPGQLDTNNGTDIFLRDRTSGTTTLVSHVPDSATTAGDALSDAPVISTDGRWIAYTSRASDLIADSVDANLGADIFLYDRTTDTTQLVSHTALASNISASDVSETPGLSRDGRFVVYASRAADLVTGQSDGNAASDIFLFDRASGANRLVSHASGTPTVAGSDYSFAPSISRDGNQIAFYSAALNLAAGPDNNLDSIQHLFLYDRVADTNLLVDHESGAPARTSNGNTGSTVSEDPAYFSADGRLLTFVSNSSNLIPGQIDTNANDDVFLFDLAAGTTTLVSRSAADPNTTADDYSYSPSIDADGSHIAYRSGATNLVTGQIDTNTFQDVFVFARATGANTLVSHALTAPATTGDGGSGDAPRVGSPAISPDGRAIVFKSQATNLIADHIDSNGINSDLFLYDLATGANVLLTHALGTTTTTGNGGSGDNQPPAGPVWSANGRLLLFGSRAANLIASDFNKREDVFAFPIPVPPGLVQITSIERLTEGHIVLRGTGVPESDHTLEASPDLSSGSFAFLASVRTNATGTWQYEDSEAGGFTKRFYRLLYP